MGGGEREREIGRIKNNNWLTFSCLHISLPESPVWEVSAKPRHKKRTRQGMRISFQIPVPMRGGVSLRTMETRPGFRTLNSNSWWAEVGGSLEFEDSWGYIGRSFLSGG